MNHNNSQKRNRKRPFQKMVLFPIVVLAIYGILFAITPGKAFGALRSSGTVLLAITLPLVFVLIVMLVMNLFLKPAQIADFLGRDIGIRGFTLSAAAGIVSMGPIYVWYPLLKKLRDEGVGNGPIAIFLYNRAVKPFLLPVMIAYFGWAYVGILTLLTVLASIAMGYCMHIFIKRRETPPISN